jgi:CRISPR-associated protein Csd2
VKEAINNRYDFVYYFDVSMGNPNGDPDAGNLPRIDPETGFGLVTDVCLKRKIRNYVDIVKGNKSPYRIYIQERAILNDLHMEAHEAVHAKDSDESKTKRKGTAEEVQNAREWMCENYFDVRAFGAVMTLEWNCGQVRGPVQLTFARSCEPITTLETTITRMAVATQREAEKQQGDNRTMGRKNVVPYGLYRAEGFVSAKLAEKTGFSQEDLDLVWAALREMFEHDRSAARGMMAPRKLVVFKHDNALGSAHAHDLFNLVNHERVNSGPARSFADWRLNFDSAACPPGVAGIEIL